MKYLTAFALVATTLFSSCSNDNTAPIVLPDFMPLTIGSFWTYTTEGTTNPQTGELLQGTDSLYVASEDLIGTYTYANLDASTESTGFMTSLFSENHIRTQNEKLYLQGSYDLDLSTLGGSAHQIAIDDAALYDTNAMIDMVLYTNSGSITDPVSVGGQDVELIINYTIKSIQKERFESFDVAGQVFVDVLKSHLIISAKIDAVVEIVPGFPSTINVAPLQDINTVENYYADGIGLIQSSNDFSIQFNTTVAAQLGIPEVIEAPTNQKIASFLIAE